MEGEIQHKPDDFQVAALWQVLLGQKVDRDNAHQVTVFDSVDFALDDFSALHFMFAAANELELGERTALIPQLANPKNLFGLLSRTPRDCATQSDMPSAA